ncbi:hypothetical protein T03_11728 [Trichinella britovi]|uniref:Uncharacterized protein n=1 Tax=Trichinella britovi TaxID=45882 RepID=A0A0V1DEG8_TRIBR|nr:hypothetical protein T03_11728 [Trichinella britovi]
MLPRECEPGKKGSRAGGSQTEDMTARRNLAVDTSPSSPSHDCDNSPDGVTNEPAREIGSLHKQVSFNDQREMYLLM